MNQLRLSTNIIINASCKILMGRVSRFHFASFSFYSLNKRKRTNENRKTNLRTGAIYKYRKKKHAIIEKYNAETSLLPYLCGKDANFQLNQVKIQF